MKRRTGKECKKTTCKWHAEYSDPNPLAYNMKQCWECKWAHVSQYEKKETKK